MHEFMRVSYSILRLSGAESATNPLNSLPVACRRPFVVVVDRTEATVHTHTGSAPVVRSIRYCAGSFKQVSRQTDGRDCDHPAAPTPATNPSSRRNISNGRKFYKTSRRRPPRSHCITEQHQEESKQLLFRCSRGVKFLKCVCDFPRKPGSEQNFHLSRKVISRS